MKYKYKPKTKKELEMIIMKEIEIQGINADLNMIDTSLITDMSDLFYMSSFNGDISKWNVSNVVNMCCMFGISKFNGDISQWDVSNVVNMCCMFEDSDFNGDISKWNVKNVRDASSLFQSSKFSGDISDWDVSNVKHAKSMMVKSNIPDKVKATILLKLSKNDNCIFDKVIEGYNGKNNVVEFVLNNFNYNDICYAFKKANIPYKKVMHLIPKLLNFDCMYNIYPMLYGKMIDDMLDI